MRFERRILSVNDLPLFDSLEEHDIMFVDSSHLMMEGLDLDIIMNRILPRLKSGVVIHFHDIFLPYGYPVEWERRHYSEQNALVGWILSDFLRVEFPGHYAVSRYSDLVTRELGDFAPFENLFCCSFWVRRS